MEKLMTTKAVEKQLGNQLKSGDSIPYRNKLINLLISRLQSEANLLKQELDTASVGLDPTMFAAIYGARASAYYVLLREIKSLEEEIKLLG